MVVRTADRGEGTEVEMLLGEIDQPNGGANTCYEGAREWRGP